MNQRCIFGFFLAFLMLTIGVRAQTEEQMDSLKVLVESATHDTAKIHLSCLYAEWNHNNRFGFWDTMRMRIDTFLENEAFLSKEEIRVYKTCKAQSLNNLGYIIKHDGEISLTLDYYMRSVEIYKELDNHIMTAYGLNNIGYIYDRQGDIEKALAYYHEGLMLHERNGNQQGVATSLSNIGYVHAQNGELEEAVEYNLKVLEIREEAGEPSDIARSLNNLGYLYSQQESFELALEYYQRGLKLQNELGRKVAISISLNNIGSLYRRMKDFEKSRAYYVESLKVNTGDGAKLINRAQTLINLAGHYIRTNKPDSAAPYADECFEIANKIAYPELIGQAASVMDHLHRKNGRYKEALEMFELHIQMKDSINNEKTQKATIRQQTKYEFEKAQLVKEQEEQEAARVIAEETSRRDNLQYSVILISLLVISGLLAVIGRFSIPMRVAEGLIFFAFLIFFEFILVLGDPYVEDWTGGAPGLKLLINAGVAALIFPLHAFFERMLKSRLVV